ncbi:MAG: phosphatase PAP2 family protein, partial [Vallitaleaceae bacterium]|nr:phosphatase PAP2 family protein [Vallitaleaceae bacterium]
NWGLIWCLISLCLLASKIYKQIGVMTLCSLLLCTALGEGVIKNLIARPRPFVSVPILNMLIKLPLSYSFPSVHTASAFACAGILATSFKKYTLPLYALAISIAFSRMYLYVHYPTDILGGIFLGVICAKLVLIMTPHINNYTRRNL